MNEDLDGMTTEQLMLRDLIYEIHDELEQANQEELPGYRLGVLRIASLLQQKLESFNIDQSRFARQMPDVEAWYFGSVK
jgi:hypothetical protein